MKQTSLVLSLSVLLAHTAAAATLTVQNSNDTGPGSLRELIGQAVSGDTITFLSPGVVLLTSGPIVIGSNIQIQGLGASATIIDGNQTSSVFQINRGVVVSLDDLTIQNAYNSINSAQSLGGAIRNSGTLTLTDCNLIHNNTEFGTGGAIANVRQQAGDAVILNLTRCTISQSHALSGSAIHNGIGCVLDLEDVVLEASAGPPYGSSLLNSGDAVLSRCLIAGGTSGVRGIENSGTLKLANSTVTAHNLAEGNGGGIQNSGALRVDCSTISGNTAARRGGGIYNTGTAQIKNSILAANAFVSPIGAGPDIYGPVSSFGYNLIGDSSAAVLVPATGDQVGSAASPINPMLGALANNGGFSKTCALLPGSPAINTGDCNDMDGNAVETDQRGSARQQGGRCDIGAFEVTANASSIQVQLPAPLVLNSNGRCEIRVSLKAQVQMTGAPVRVDWIVDGVRYDTQQARASTGTKEFSFLADYELGKHNVTVNVTDSNGGKGSANTTVTVEDRSSPRINRLTASPSTLSPANGKMVPVTLSAQVTDNCGPASWKIVSVRSNGPGQEESDQSAQSDWQITGKNTVLLRASRFDRRKDRIYTITIESVDQAGNTSKSNVHVKVPRKSRD